MGEGDGPLRVPVPERLDRPLRLGPFASGRDALKFVAYLAVGSLVVPWGGPLAWLPFVALGATMALWRPDGLPVDERAVRWASYWLRRAGGRYRLMAGARGGPGRRTSVRLPGGRAAVVRSAGLPLAYLPPADLHRKFEQFRELLGASGGQLAWLSTRAAILPVPYLPAEPAPVGAEAGARAGYRELVELIVRRRNVRQVFWAVVLPEAEADATDRLEAEARSVVERLQSLGVHPTRLRDRALTDAARRLTVVEGDGGR